MADDVEQNSRDEDELSGQVAAANAAYGKDTRRDVLREALKMAASDLLGKDARRTMPRRLLTATVGAVSLSVAGVAAGILTNAFTNSLEGAERPIAAISAAALGAISGLLGLLTSRRADRAAVRAEAAFREAAVQAVTSVEGEAEPSIEDELSDVSDSLSAAVNRLRRISEKAEAFEAEVHGLVTRAEAARATASLHEDDARRIASILTAESGSRLHDEIGRLTVEHKRQIDHLRRAGNRAAIWTFVGGVVLGIIGNIVVALWLG